MEIRQLEALIGIAEHGSFSGAAAGLGTVQSNISGRIAKLEDELGTELVDRSTGLLTEAGVVTAERARVILREMAAIASDVAEITSEVRGVVSIGMIGTAGRWIVPMLLDAQRSRFPHVALRIKEGTNSALEPQVVSGHLDIAVLAFPVSAPELSDRPLFAEDLLLVVEKDHPLATTTSPLTLSEVSKHEIFLPMTGTPIRREIDDACTKAGVTLASLIEVDGVRTIASMVFDGHGPAILPATMLTPRLRTAFVGLPIADLSPRHVVVANRRFGFPTAPVRAINELLSSVVREAPHTPDGVYVE